MPISCDAIDSVLFEFLFSLLRLSPARLCEIVYLASQMDLAIHRKHVYNDII